MTIIDWEQYQGFMDQLGRIIKALELIAKELHEKNTQDKYRGSAGEPF